MTRIEVRVSQKHSTHEAMKRIKDRLSELEDEYSDVISEVEEVWTETHGNVNVNIKGYDIEFSIEVTEIDVMVSGEIPAPLFLFRGSIKDSISEELEKILNGD